MATIMGFAAGPYKTNCYVLIGEAAEAVKPTAAVIDPGMHTAARVLELLAEHGASLEAIVLTHGHIDHTRDAAELAQTTGATVYIHPADAFMLVDGSGVSEASRQLFDVTTMAPITDPTPLIDGHRLALAGEDFQVTHAPGHSPGSTLLVGKQLCFSGDVLFRGSIGRTDLPHSDPAAMAATLRGPVLGLADALTIAPGHGPTTTMRAERAGNPFLVGL